MKLFKESFTIVWQKLRRFYGNFDTSCCQKLLTQVLLVFYSKFWQKLLTEVFYISFDKIVWQTFKKVWQKFYKSLTQVLDDSLWQANLTKVDTSLDENCRQNFYIFFIQVFASTER
jgi:hypothetical protein